MSTINPYEIPKLQDLERVRLSAHQKTLFLELKHYTILELIGDNSSDFLQGQITCDIRNVNDTNMRQGTLCNLKGRIMALLDVVWWNGRFLLILPRVLAPSIEHTLSKVALFSRVRVVPLSESKIYGVIHSTLCKNEFTLNTPEAPYQVYATKDSCCYRLNAQQSLYITSSTSLTPPFSTHLEFGEYLWHIQQLEAGIPSFYPCSQGLFLPHHLGFHKTSILNFEKGCYKGQEIIARMHYRAVIKNTPQLLLIDHLKNLFPGQKITNPDNQQYIGELVDFSPYTSSQTLILTSLSTTKFHALVFEKEENKPRIASCFSNKPC